MKKHIIFLILLFCFGLLSGAQNNRTIRISTDKTDLILEVNEEGRLYQTYLGHRFKNESEISNLKWDEYAYTDGLDCKRGGEAYSAEGNEDYFEPALGIIHNDGNRSTRLYYKSHEQKPVDGGTQTVIVLQDDLYPVTVSLHYVAFNKDNIIKMWTEISHNEKKPVTLTQYASAMLYFKRSSYHLTEFSGDWAMEARPSVEILKYGKKEIETKQGTRAAEFSYPFFEIGMDTEAREDGGEVLMGTIGWNGNFRFTFEVDNHNVLRVLPGINPHASDYRLAPGELFTTPEFYFTLADGLGEGSRNFHAWARRHQLKNGMGDRMTLLNNWENTYFNFDQNKLAGIMKEGKMLGVDMFLLDDGWFGNGEDARNSDRSGLGDWEPNSAKLPDGVPGLVRTAKETEIKFGIWIEPEMINPQSKLMRKHPDWAMVQPGRETYHFRHQLALDMANPAVQDHVFGVVDKLMTENPELAFFKWDCNSPITNKFSPYLKTNQSQMYIDHTRGVYKVMERVSEKYPDLPMMLCSGGGGRCDYESLKHFTEFWLSDNTDPVERCYIQWNFSQFFPAKSMCAHVTSWNEKASVKFRVDVASMCKLGFDIGFQDLGEKDIRFCATAISNWNRLKPVILDGEMYRLVSPFETDHMAVQYVGCDRNKALVFAYNLFPRYGEEPLRVKFQGLDPDKRYSVREINLEEGVKGRFHFEGKVFSGDFLMNVGLNILASSHLTSHVIELSAE